MRGDHRHWGSFFGKSAVINLFGQIVLSPITIIMCATCSVMEILFKRGE